MEEVLGFALALGITAAAIPLLARLAPGWGLIAQSGPRMQHEGSIPTVGGLAMGVAFLAAYAVTGLMSYTTSLSPLLAVAVAITLAGGVLDDRHELRSLPKFAFQIAAAALLALYGDALLTHLGQLMSPELFTLGRWAAPLSIFALVGVMNAMNMTDGLDGLAGALALAACISFGAAASFARPRAGIRRDLHHRRRHARVPRLQRAPALAPPGRGLHGRHRQPAARPPARLVRGAPRDEPSAPPSRRSPRCGSSRCRSPTPSPCSCGAACAAATRSTPTGTTCTTSSSRSAFPAPAPPRCCSGSRSRSASARSSPTGSACRSTRCSTSTWRASSPGAAWPRSSAGGYTWAPT